MENEEYIEAATEGSRGARFREFVAKAESTYLSVLRIATLLIATAIIAYIAWLLLAGLYNISKDAASVHEAPAKVTASELAQMSLASSDSEKSSARAEDSSGKQTEKFYSDFLKRYYGLFAANFEKYRQESDKQLSMKAFDDKFLHTDERRQAIETGELNYATDRADLESLYKIMGEAADLPTTKTHLSAYRQAKKERVEKKVKKTRSERYCSYYGYYVDECLLYDTRSVPYTETVVSYELPKGVLGYQEIFGRYQDNYLSTLASRRDENQFKANSDRRDIEEANARGKEQFRQALVAGASFLALMFFFLLIAIERHQRRIAVQLD